MNDQQKSRRAFEHLMTAARHYRAFRDHMLKAMKADDPKHVVLDHLPFERHAEEPVAGWPPRNWPDEVRAAYFEEYHGLEPTPGKTGRVLGPYVPLHELHPDVRYVTPSRRKVGPPKTEAKIQALNDKYDQRAEPRR